MRSQEIFARGALRDVQTNRKMSTMYKHMGEVIRALRSRAKLSLQALANEVENYDAGNLSRFERGAQQIEPEKLAQLAKALGRRMSELYAMLEEDPRVSRANTEAGPSIKGEYPLISWVQAGSWNSISDEFSPGDAESYYAAPRKCGPRTFLLRVRGRSMEPKYSDGDLIFVDPAVQYQHGSNVIVKLPDEEEGTFKRLVIEGSKIWLEPLNPDWPEKAIQLSEDAVIVGVVIGKWVPD